MTSVAADCNVTERLADHLAEPASITPSSLSQSCPTVQQLTGANCTCKSSGGISRCYGWLTGVPILSDWANVMGDAVEVHLRHQLARDQIQRHKAAKLAWDLGMGSDLWNFIPQGREPSSVPSFSPSLQRESDPQCSCQCWGLERNLRLLGDKHEIQTKLKSDVSEFSFAGSSALGNL